MVQNLIQAKTGMMIMMFTPLFLIYFVKGGTNSPLIGKAKVSNGWDMGVATMRRGEKAVFTIKSVYN